jgi:hypothetical protein
MQIDGPVNIVRIEGKVNNINKILYVFFDYHHSLHEQSKCDSYDSVNITKFFYNLFKNISYKLDFFLEIRQTQYNHYDSSNYNKMYIHENIKLYNKIKNAKFKNTRFHYIDIRDILMETIQLSFDWLIFSDPLNNIRKTRIINSDDYNNYIYNIKLLYNRLILIHKIILNIKDDNNYKNKLKKLFPSGKKNSEQKIYYVLYKIFYRYSHYSLFTNFINNYIKQILDYLNICISTITKTLNLLYDHESDCKGMLKIKVAGYVQVVLVNF